MELNSFFEKILNELSYQVKEGIPDLTNETHIVLLKQILLEETDYNYLLVNEIIDNIRKQHLTKISEAGRKKEPPAPTPAPESDSKSNSETDSKPNKKSAPAPTDEPAPTDKPAPTDAPAPTNSKKKSVSRGAPKVTDDNTPSPDSGNTPQSAEEPTGNSYEKNTSDDNGKTNNNKKDNEKKPKEKDVDKSKDTEKKSNQALINMKNAKQSGVFFLKPNTQYIVSPSVDAVYEHPDGALFMKIGDDEFQINICPYTGYKAAIKLNPFKNGDAKDTGQYINVAPNHKTDVKPKNNGEE